MILYSYVCMLHMVSIYIYIYFLFLFCFFICCDRLHISCDNLIADIVMVHNTNNQCLVSWINDINIHTYIYIYIYISYNNVMCISYKHYTHCITHISMSNNHPHPTPPRPHNGLGSSPPSQGSPPPVDCIWTPNPNSIFQYFCT